MASYQNGKRIKIESLLNEFAQNLVKSSRLRTLPLSFSGILIEVHLHSHQILILTSFLHVLTRLFKLYPLANDLGDAVKGVDDETRIGPERAIQSGMITKAQMKNAILSSAYWL